VSVWSSPSIKKSPTVISTGSLWKSLSISLWWFHEQERYPKGVLSIDIVSGVLNDYFNYLFRSSFANKHILDNFQWKESPLVHCISSQSCNGPWAYTLLCCVKFYPPADQSVPLRDESRWHNWASTHSKRRTLSSTFLGTSLKALTSMLKILNRKSELFCREGIFFDREIRIWSEEV